MDRAELSKTVSELWDTAVMDGLTELVRIPAVSSSFDAQWEESGHLGRAVEHMRAWIEARGLREAQVEVVTLPGRGPLLLVDVPASSSAAAEAGTVLLYGHLDKQPPFDGWSEGLSAWEPVRKGDQLFGRGAVDDGYSGFAATAAIEAIQRNGGEHGRCVLLLETGEESGSPDLPAYLEHLSERLGTVSFVICLDAGGADYRRLWLVTSLRGLLQVHVTAKVLDAAQHSGVASGAVASSMRVLRVLLDRLENSATGECLVDAMNVEVPADRLAEVRDMVADIPGYAKAGVALAPGVSPVTEDDLELALNTTWRPTLSVIGAEGMPAPEDAGNVLRASTTLCLSFRLPPTADSAAALADVRKLLTTDVPYGAHVELSGVEAADGWNAPTLTGWLSTGLDEVSTDIFDDQWRALGMGGSIPFMGLLAERYPAAQFLVTGALGPDSNMHVADESLNVPFATKVTKAIAVLLDAHARSAG
ncbi:M20/M25/M40 family metallo-hydrolase [Sciscionella sediminilitoris]|uniref:M20/M25/M40 family metallo-hydrolase n=1 Tax=Sciscionella sediminilitoris TaxID=1445613 RepID=UPI0004DEEA8B|nr:M20/M25/M40 family metallo-hydrolase [Sciscionella sp. SE31]